MRLLPWITNIRTEMVQLARNRKWTLLVDHYHTFGWEYEWWRVASRRSILSYVMHIAMNDFIYPLSRFSTCWASYNMMMRTHTYRRCNEIFLISINSVFGSFHFEDILFSSFILSMLVMTYGNRNFFRCRRKTKNKSTAQIINMTKRKKSRATWSYKFHGLQTWIEEVITIGYCTLRWKARKKRGEKRMCRSGTIAFATLLLISMFRKHSMPSCSV